MCAPRHSLALRVTAAFLLIVGCAAAGLGAYLYRAFVAEVERRDDIQLLGKLRQVETLLGRPDAAELVRSHPDYFRDTMSGQENALVRIIAADGTVLADINPAGERYPVPAPADTATNRDAIASWSARDGAPGRVVAGRAHLDGKPVAVVVARAYVERNALFARYRAQIVAASAVCALVSALLAALMLRQGLRPLQAIARQAALVRPGTLTQRFNADGAPSELGPVIDAFNAMLARLQAGYERLSGFSADLAHEFRTPVANLLGQSQVILAQRRSAEDYEQLIASNIEELERLARMIDSMLFLARAQQHEVVLDRQVLAAQAELERVADFFEGMADERGLRFACGGACEVVADPALLRRALANLVSNAVRHATAHSTIALGAHERDGVVEITVANQGMPIPPRHLPHVFERFYRVDPARGETDRATGLGLSIVSAIMLLHGGSARVHSDPGATVFTLCFPCAPAGAGR